MEILQSISRSIDLFPINRFRHDFYKPTQLASILFEWFGFALKLSQYLDLFYYICRKVITTITTIWLWTVSYLITSGLNGNVNGIRWICWYWFSCWCWFVLQNVKKSRRSWRWWNDLPFVVQLETYKIYWGKWCWEMVKNCRYFVQKYH